MPINNAWDNDAKTIIRQTLIDPWTWEEFTSATREAADMMRPMPHPVDLLCDIRQGTHVPPGVFSKPMLVAKEYPPNWRLMIVVAENSFVESLVIWTKRLFSRPFGQRLHYCMSLEEAYRMIQQQV
jgi:hypothetical protein